MEQDSSSLLQATEAAMDKCIEHFGQELAKIRAGKASPMMIDSLQVDYYGSMMPLNQVANVSAPDARTLTIQPFEQKMIPPIERVIIDSNLGYNPQNDGVLIRINLPVMTEERRKQLVKQVKDETEQARVALRNIRRDSNEQFKKLNKAGLSDDEAKAGEAEIQKLTDKFNAQIDTLTAQKEQEVMTV